MNKATQHQYSPERRHTAHEVAVKEDEVDKSLSAIFENEDGKMPNLKVLEPRRRSRRLLLWIAGIVGGTVAVCLTAWLAIRWVKPYQGFDGKALHIVVDGPGKVTLGQETTYFINWQNLSKIPLSSADVRVSFPVDFAVTQIDPQTQVTDFTWKLGSIPVQGRGTILVKGIFTGGLGTKTALQIVGTYRPVSFQSDFEEVVSFPLEYTDTVLQGALQVPPKILPGDGVVFMYDIQNTGLQALKDLEARFTLPEGFVRDATSSIGQIEGRVVHIPLTELAAGATTSVSVRGSFASGVSGEMSLHAEIGRAGFDGVFQAIAKQDTAFAVMSGDLSLILIANGSDTDQSIGFGDALRVTLSYENTATEDIKNVQLRFLVQPIAGTADKKNENANYVDWSQLENSASGTRTGNVLSWDKKNIPILERITPQQDGSIEVSIPVSQFSTSTNFLGFQLVAEATIGTVGSIAVNRLVKTAPMVFHLRTDADLAVEARYFSEEGAPLGSGPLPPVVGQTTAYRVMWNINKHVHELKNIRVVTTLPTHVTWPQKVTTDAGSIVYDTTARTVTWSLNRLPNEVNEAHAEFEIQLTPSAFDVGRFADLIGETRFEIVDAPLSETIVRVKPALSTDLSNDEGAKSKGVVRKP